MFVDKKALNFSVTLMILVFLGSCGGGGGGGSKPSAAKKKALPPANDKIVWNDLSDLPAHITAIEALMAKGNAGAAVATWLPTQITDMNFDARKPGGWSNFTLAPNGKLYACPLVAASVLVFDPEDPEYPVFLDETVNPVATLATNLTYFDGILALNESIYCIPAHNERVLKIDTKTDTMSFIGAATGDLASNFGAGQYKWESAAIAPNGKIYAPPSNASVGVLVIDTADDTFSFLPTDTTTDYAWGGAALHKNGKIYAAPANDNRILVIDPENAVTPISYIATSLTNDTVEKFYGFVYDLKESFFAIPFQLSHPFVASKLYVFDLSSKLIASEIVQATGGVQVPWSAGAFGLNGKIYGVPFESDSLYEVDREDPTGIDPTKASRLIGDYNDQGGDKFGAPAYGLDGKMYFVPRTADRVLMLDLKLNETPDVNILLSPFVRAT